MKKYRVWYHYFREKRAMSVHFKGTCTIVQNIDCKVPVETKWNKIQPNLVLRGWATSVKILGDKAIIE